jgi:hypothetical protein
MLKAKIIGLRILISTQSPKGRPPKPVEPQTPVVNLRVYSTKYYKFLEGGSQLIIWFQNSFPAG